MADIIFLTGAPGSGKSTVAAKLHEILGSPWFEFGWIPEFRQLNPHTTISYEEEAAMSAENLALVVENYLKHGFENVIVTDLEDEKIVQMYERFVHNQRIIVRLHCDDETTKTRILERNNGNEYRDWEAALEISKNIAKRPPLDDEIVLDSGKMSVDELAQTILRAL